MVEVHTDNDGVGDTFDQILTYDADKPDAEPEFENRQGRRRRIRRLDRAARRRWHRGPRRSADTNSANDIEVDRDGDNNPDEIHVDDNEDGNITTILINPDGTTETINRIWQSPTVGVTGRGFRRRDGSRVDRPVSGNSGDDPLVGWTG